MENQQKMGQQVNYILLRCFCSWVPLHSCDFAFDDGPVLHLFKEEKRCSQLPSRLPRPLAAHGSCWSAHSARRRQA